MKMNCDNLNNHRPAGSATTMHILRGLKLGKGSLFLVTRTVFFSRQIDRYLIGIHILRLDFFLAAIEHFK